MKTKLGLISGEKIILLTIWLHAVIKSKFSEMVLFLLIFLKSKEGSFIFHKTYSLF